MDNLEKIRLELVREALSFPLHKFLKRDGSINRAKLRQIEPDFQSDALKFIFIRKAIDVHGVFFGYEESEFRSMQQQVKIWCPDHEGYFMQSARSHLDGYGCQRCSKSTIVRKNEYGEFRVPCPLHKFSIDDDHIIWYNKFNKLKLPLETNNDTILDRA